MTVADSTIQQIEDVFLAHLGTLHQQAGKILSTLKH